MTDVDEDYKPQKNAEQQGGLFLLISGAFFGLCSAGATYMGFRPNTGFFTALVGIPLWGAALGAGIITGAYFAQRRRIFASILLIITASITVVNWYIDTISLTEVSANNEERRVDHNTRVSGAAAKLNQSVTRKTEIDTFMERARHEDPVVVMDAQRQLKDLGFYVPGVGVDEFGRECGVLRTKIDGVRGGCTEVALQAWQQFYKIPEELRELETSIKENGEIAKVATIDEPSMFDKRAARMTAIVINVLAFMCTVGAGYARRGESELAKVLAEKKALRAEMSEKQKKIDKRIAQNREDMARREKQLLAEIEHREKLVQMSIEQKNRATQERSAAVTEALGRLQKMTGQIVRDMKQDGSVG